MPFHVWGDKAFDWKALDKAISQGTWLMSKLGRIGVHSKEKFGTARWSIYLFNGQLHSLTHPGYVYSRYPKWLWSFDVIHRPLRFLVRPIQFYQALIIKLTFLYLWYKFPHIRPEVFSDAPRELLIKKHSKFAASFWQTSCKSCETMVNCAEDFCPSCGKEIKNQE
jgi:hypothetical protein